MKNTELKAYSVYYGEILGRIDLAEEALFSGARPSLREIQAARNEFHKLKGGAGFFDLGEIERAAGQIEETLSTPSGVSDLSIVAELIKDFSNLAKSLPQPPPLPSKRA